MVPMARRSSDAEDGGTTVPQIASSHRRIDSGRSGPVSRGGSREPRFDPRQPDLAPVGVDRSRAETVVAPLAGDAVEDQAGVVHAFEFAGALVDAVLDAVADGRALPAEAHHV